jgi:hypothetical protein
MIEISQRERTLKTGAVSRRNEGHNSKVVQAVSQSEDDS